MAYVLSLPPHSPLKRSFSDHPYLNSCSPLKDSRIGLLGDIATHNTSACSLYSFASSRLGERLLGNENTPPLPFQSPLVLAPRKSSFALSIIPVAEKPYKQNLPVARQCHTISPVAAPSNPFSKKPKNIQYAVEPSLDSEAAAEDMYINDNSSSPLEVLDLYENISIPLTSVCAYQATDENSQKEHERAVATLSINSKPFRRWMSTLRRRHALRPKENLPHATQLSLKATAADLVTELPPGQLLEPVGRTSESMSSSLGCITAVKSASMTIGSTSNAPHSDARMHGGARSGNRSSNHSDARRSVESHGGLLGPVIDERAWLRSLQRRKVVEELIASEESYIADLKVLINVSTPRT